MHYLDGLFRGLDEPTSDHEEEIQLMIPKSDRDGAILANSEGFCYLCERGVGVDNLTVKRYHDTDTLKPLCQECKQWANLPHWLIEYATARKNRWRDRLAYEASESAKTERIRKQSRAAKAKKSRAIKLAAKKRSQDTPKIG